MRRIFQLIDQQDERTKNNRTHPYHNGGRILFGPDHKLYVMIGDGHQSVNAQDRSDNLRGKIVRLDPDGTGAKGNPFGSRIWSYGHRNSYGFTFDPATHRLWETENGPECTDEINLVVKGANFGWGPKESCSLAKPAGTNNSGPKPRHLPKRFFPSTIGITGDAFCHRCGIGSLDGQLVFGDVNAGRLRAIHLNAARTGFSSKPRVIATAPTGVHSVEASPDGPSVLQRTERDLPPGRDLSRSRRGPSREERTWATLGEPTPGEEQRVDIGRPQRIIEIEPVSLPIPSPDLPAFEPAPAPAPEPAPADPTPAEPVDP